MCLMYMSWEIWLAAVGWRLLFHSRPLDITTSWVLTVHTQYSSRHTRYQCLLKTRDQGISSCTGMLARVPTQPSYNPPPPPPPPPPPAHRGAAHADDLDALEVGDVLGKGGGGIVFRGRLGTLDVAVKVRARGLWKTCSSQMTHATDAVRGLRYLVWALALCEHMFGPPC